MFLISEYTLSNLINLTTLQVKLLDLVLEKCSDNNVMNTKLSMLAKELNVTSRSTPLRILRRLEDIGIIRLFQHKKGVMIYLRTTTLI